MQTDDRSAAYDPCGMVQIFVVEEDGSVTVGGPQFQWSQDDVAWFAAHQKDDDGE